MIKKWIKNKKPGSVAMQYVRDYKKMCKMFFAIWIITFIAFIGLLSYTIYLANETGTEKTTKTENIDIDQENNNGNNNIINGSQNKVNN